MSRARLPRLFAGALLVVGIAAAAIALNLLLLRSLSTSDEPVGRLSPRAGDTPPPAWMTHPTTGRPEDEGADD
jgi:hypothetical protein